MPVLSIEQVQRSGTFQILSFNIAGLPEKINDNGIPGGKEKSTRTIGTKLKQSTYDIINVQEVTAHQSSTSRSYLTGQGLPLPRRALVEGHAAIPYRDIG